MWLMFHGTLLQFSTWKQMHIMYIIYKLFSHSIYCFVIFFFTHRVIFLREKCLVLFLSLVLRHSAGAPCRMSISGCQSTEDFPPVHSFLRLPTWSSPLRRTLTQSWSLGHDWVLFGFNYHIHNHQLPEYKCFYRSALKKNSTRVTTVNSNVAWKHYQLYYFMKIAIGLPFSLGKLVN